MSGHSHYATTHRQKELKDAAKGQIFSKLARLITIAAKTGGGPSPDSNYKLKVAIEKARSANMPKENIERAITKASGGEALDEVTYEGFGPGGFFVMVEGSTDNRNRTGQEIKNLFEKNGGRFGGPGSVAFNFDPKGLLVIKKEADTDSQMLGLIDAGAQDLEMGDGEIEAYVAPAELFSSKQKIEELGFSVISTEVIQKPKTTMLITEPEKVQKAISFLDNIEEHEDVHKVFANIDIPDSLSLNE